jgi:YggT family protein
VGVRFATFGLLADAVSTLQDFVAVFVGVYVLVIFVYVIASFFRLPSSFNPVLRFLYDVCEPYLRLFRRFLPSFGGLDLSPMVALFVLWIVSGFLIRLIDNYA